MSCCVPFFFTFTNDNINNNIFVGILGFIALIVFKATKKGLFLFYTGKFEALH